MVTVVAIFRHKNAKSIRNASNIAQIKTPAFSSVIILEAKSQKESSYYSVLRGRRHSPIGDLQRYSVQSKFADICPIHWKLHEQHTVEDGKFRPWCRHLANWTKHTRRIWSLAYSLQYVKTWRRPQNRKYIIYCIAVRRGPSHGYRWHVQKIWLNLNVMFLKNASWQKNKQTDKQTNRHTDTLIAILRLLGLRW